MSDINSFLNGFIDIILRMSIYDLVDILIVAYIFYKIFMFLMFTLSSILNEIVVLLPNKLFSSTINS